MIDLLGAAAARWPKQSFLISGTQTWTYYQANTQASLPPTTPSPITLHGTPTPATIITLLSRLKHGLPTLLINPKLPNPAPEPNHLSGAESLYLYTSGSSGPPKLAHHTSASMRYNAKCLLPHIHLTPNSKIRMQLPLYHVSGLSWVFRALLSGAALVFHDQLPVSHLSLVPTQLIRYLKTDPASLQHLTTLLIGGAPLSPEWHTHALNHDIPLTMTYGLTETASAIALQKPGQATACTLDGHTLLLNDKNEILIKTPALFQGYATNTPFPHTSLPLTDTGYFNTHDIATGTPKAFQLQGRSDNLIISGGENIHPEEIEQLLLTFPEITHAHVTPIPHPEYGQRPIAYLIPAPNHAINATTLKAKLQDHLPSYKIPDQFLPWPDHLPQKGSEQNKLHKKMKY